MPEVPGRDRPQRVAPVHHDGIGLVAVGTGKRGGAQHPHVWLCPHERTARHPDGADRRVRERFGGTGLIRSAGCRQPARLGQRDAGAGRRSEPGVGQRGARGDGVGTSRDDILAQYLVSDPGGDTVLRARASPTADYEITIEDDRVTRLTLSWLDQECST